MNRGDDILGQLFLAFLLHHSHILTRARSQPALDVYHFEGNPILLCRNQSLPKYSISWPTIFMEAETIGLC